MRLLRFVVTPLLISMLPAAAAAQQRTDVPAVQLVVFPLSGFALGNAEQQREMAEAFRSLVMTELAGMRVQLVERERLDGLLQAQNLSLTGAVSDDVALRIGQLLGARYAVAGSISADRNTARLDLRLFDVETGLTVHTWKDETRQDRVLSLANRVATEFAGRAVLTPHALPVQIPAAASLAYSQGLDFERRGRRQDAARMYSRVLELFPQHPHARAALQRVN
jgi:TolB-like protein